MAGASVLASATAPASGVCPERANRCPATIAIVAKSAIAITDQRMASEDPDVFGGATSDVVTPGKATGVPHRWQNLAPGASSALQAPQATAPSGEPQDEQNRPEAGAPQFGQGLEAVGSLMCVNLANGEAAGSGAVAG